ncbi:hypothetical protein ZOD2009_15126 [Haladaptatus paucihalophilus DX253]|uniref:Sulfatase n=1 Tax=Haladaptatus paucihalophilus DX253 TaxID=797209 RepID=E7QW37_HALPU|nr:MULTISPECIES: hypothetical protein [Haladaptatus]EFW91171.1 hypothetical protein ZOD2009_15126 [Haladaptatus paucihalophilus DX253]SHL66750.1 hypothetical protein SAMN05444342_4372 [Haladaptatus paucihalophilus DX253]
MNITETIRRVRRGIKEPHLVTRELNKHYYKRKEPSPDAVEFFDEDWDNLIILDACRYDTFKKCNTLPGELQSRQTKSSSTPDFLATYFDGADLRDTVYVTANPQLYRKRDRIDVQLHDVINIWQDEGWDDEFRTVRPETVVDVAKDAAEQYPDKRLVVHFIQPHYPFIGPTGKEHLDLDSLDFWNRVMAGEVDVPVSVLYKAYEENVEMVLPHVEELLSTLQGKSVVTADHGEAFGERARPIPMAEYGHPNGIYIPQLTTVPWLVHQNGARRSITEGDEGEHMEEDVSVDVEQRLQDLGYA